MSAKHNLSIIPSRRKDGPAYYEWTIELPNAMQVRSAVKPFEKRYKRPFPVWVTLLMFLSGVVGIIGLLITISE
jgi:hypothetical protein